MEMRSGRINPIHYTALILSICQSLHPYLATSKSGGFSLHIWPANEPNHLIRLLRDAANACCQIGNLGKPVLALLCA